MTKPYFRRGIAWLRVTGNDRKLVELPMAPRGRPVRDSKLAAKIAAWLDEQRDAGEWDLIDAIATRKFTAWDAYSQFHATPAAKEGPHRTRRQRGVDAVMSSLEDVALAPLVDPWQAALAKHPRPNTKTRAKYRRQVEAFLTAQGPDFRVSKFTRVVIAGWLDGLDVGVTNRFRAALSSFARFLVRRDILPGNVVMAVDAAPERSPRARFLEDAEADRVLDALPAMGRVLHSLLNGTGLEISAALGLRRRDLDLATWQVRAFGSKTPHRNRTIVVTWAPARPLLKARCATLLADALLFPGWNDGHARRALQAACAVAKVTDYRVHDWRHTYAVRELRAGQSLQVVAHQLGHGSTIMVQKVYGRFVPQLRDYRVTVDVAGESDQSTDHASAKAAT